MVKITPMIRISNKASGFTVLEILLATALIGIVSTVGLPQTDLFAELSDRGDAIVAAEEAQNRVNVKFTNSGVKPRRSGRGYKPRKPGADFI